MDFASSCHCSQLGTEIEGTTIMWQIARLGLGKTELWWVLHLQCFKKHSSREKLAIASGHNPLARTSHVVPLNHKWSSEHNSTWCQEGKGIGIFVYNNNIFVYINLYKYTYMYIYNLYIYTNNYIQIYKYICIYTNIIYLYIINVYIYKYICIYNWKFEYLYIIITTMPVASFFSSWLTKFSLLEILGMILMASIILNPNSRVLATLLESR